MWGRGPAQRKQSITAAISQIYLIQTQNDVNKKLTSNAVFLFKGCQRTQNDSLVCHCEWETDRD